MEKMSAEQAVGIFEDAVLAIPKLAHERDGWKTKYEEASLKLASFERRDTVVKLATTMLDKGLDGGATHEELCERLEGWAQQGKLAEVQRAVELAGPNMGQKIAQVYDSGDNVGTGSYGQGFDPGTSGGGDLVRYLLDGNT